MVKNTNNRIAVLKINVAAAIFCALAYASEYLLHIKVMFLTFDIKDSIIAIAAMIFGPVYALMMGVVVATIELFTMSDTGLYGFVMNVLSTVAFTVIASLIYRYKKTIYGAVLGMISGALAMTAVMILANMIITPYYMGVTRGEVIALIPKLFLPFNLLKATFNASIAMMLYTHIVTALRRARIISARDSKSGFDGEAKTEAVGGRSLSRSIIVTLGALAVAALSIVILIFGLGANIEWF